jgi:hypothetical protein
VNLRTITIVVPLFLPKTPSRSEQKPSIRIVGRLESRSASSQAALVVSRSSPL